MIMYSNKIAFPARHSQQWQDFVRQALEKKPHLRPTAAAMLEHPWIRCVITHDSVVLLNGLLLESVYSIALMPSRGSPPYLQACESHCSTGYIPFRGGILSELHVIATQVYRQEERLRLAAVCYIDYDLCLCHRMHMQRLQQEGGSQVITTVDADKVPVVAPHSAHSAPLPASLSSLSLTSSLPKKPSGMSKGQSPPNTCLLDIAALTESLLFFTISTGR